MSSSDRLSVLRSYPIELWHDDAVREVATWPWLVADATRMAEEAGRELLHEVSRDVFFFRIDEDADGELHQVPCPAADAPWKRWRYLRKTRRPTLAYARMTFMTRLV